MIIERVGIAGFREFGSGIAYLAAIAGYPISIWDNNSKSLDLGKSSFEALTDKALEAGTIDKEKRDKIAAETTFDIDLSVLKEVDLVIEAVPEDIQLKIETSAELSDIISQKAILATTTSCFSVTEIAQAVKNPERVLGLHFFEPPHKTKLVEIIKTEISSQEPISTALDFCAKIGKEAVVSKDSPGFIVNYLFAPYMNQALEAYDHGLASREDLDLALRMGLGYPKGPMELIDTIGHEKYLRLTSILYERLLDPKFAPPAILKRMVYSGKTKK